ncbi:hypothetical protein [Aliarcobacter butzleri]|uniref:hypothetical protein n=1 Tax=Aliarcobacter butzleri TaxID=28197 RepID=UPI00263D0A4E|nr:hypothetical protein [Aliarcobacter butzleri]MDN5082010.1 hypothetical protein [Aliarcobacter butzleri]MDN5084320.1 hypothetical protein [Aliarcobacter butzleri]
MIMLSLLASTLEKYTPQELEARKIRKQNLIKKRRERIENKLKEKNKILDKKEENETLENDFEM